LKFPEILYPNNVNVNASILTFYVCHIVPRITSRATRSLAASKRAKGITGQEEFEDDGNYGSAATIDVEVLQAISKRVHYGAFRGTFRFLEQSVDNVKGKFVSESKFLENPAAFIPHILKPNREALENLITKPEVEKKLLERLRKKAAVYAQDFAPDGTPGGDMKLDITGVVELYESYIIPLTKEVEVCDARTDDGQRF
jgi:chorismate mutase